MAEQASLSVEQVAMLMSLAICSDEKWQDIHGRWLKMPDQARWLGMAQKLIDELSVKKDAYLYKGEVAIILSDRTWYPLALEITKDFKVQSLDDEEQLKIEFEILAKDNCADEKCVAVTCIFWKLSDE